MTLRILVTGSRHLGHAHRPVVRAALVKALAAHTDGRPVLVHGGAPGADQIAAEEWRKLAQVGPSRAEWGHSAPPSWWVAGLDIERHAAQWGVHGKAAGPIRNAEMVDLGAAVCLAFPLGESRGTRNCMSLAEAAGIPVVVHEVVSA